MYGVRYTLVPTLVRGLDYYTRTTWEFVGPDASTQASTISAGGRYDGLIEEIGGPPTPGVGFGAGIERLVLSLELEGIEAEPAALDVFVAVDGGSREEALRVLGELRAAGIAADVDYAGRSAKGQITQGAKRARAVVVMGEDGMTLRRPGELDVAVDVPELKDLLS
jgi:histidyl-tRNA synthetase